MRIIPVLLSAFALITLSAIARAADATSVRAVLIMASQEKAPADPRLAPYEPELQRNLPESSFRFIDEGSTSLSGQSAAAIPLARGHRIELTGGERSGSGIQLGVRWMNGKTVIMNNAFHVQPGRPVVLLRRPRGDSEIPIVIVVAK